MLECIANICEDIRQIDIVFDARKLFEVADGSLDLRSSIQSCASEMIYNIYVSYFFMQFV